jgi:hypothetical protein
VNVRKKAYEGRQTVYMRKHADGLSAPSYPGRKTTFPSQARGVAVPWSIRISATRIRVSP